MAKISRPMGARVIVKEIVTTLSLEARGKKVGLTIVTNENNRPKSTQGRVIALGTDPFLRDNGLSEGCVVTFAPHAGIRVFIEDEEFRSLEFQEIIMITTEESDAPSGPSLVNVTYLYPGPIDSPNYPQNQAPRPTGYLRDNPSVNIRGGFTAKAPRLGDATDQFGEGFAGDTTPGPTKPTGSGDTKAGD